jgi:septal ring factor EnvC (AmiA/AmiB activator)
LLPCNSLQVDRLQSLSTEIDGYKRSIAKEQEKNETLTIQYRKLENDLSLVKRQMSVCESKREALRVEYSKFTRILQESEQDLTKATTVRYCLLACLMRCPSVCLSVFSLLC